MIPKCSSFFGHNFEPRYDEGPGQEIELQRGTRQDLLEIIKATRQRRYVLDVCTRCGATINRDKLEA